MTSNAFIEGLDRFLARQLAVNGSAVRLDSTGFDGRYAISVKALAANGGKVYVGASSAVTTTDGYELDKSASLDLGLSTRASVWAIGSAAGQRVSVLEVGA